MSSNSFLAFQLFLKSVFFVSARSLGCLILIMLGVVGVMAGLSLVLAFFVFSVLLMVNLTGFLGQYSQIVNFMTTHLPWFAGFHLGCFAFVFFFSVRAQGLGVFKRLDVWRTWPTIPDASGKEISSWIAIPYWIALVAGAGPLLTVLAAVGGARLLAWFAKALIHFIRNLPAFLRQKRDHILDTNPEALARFEKSRLESGTRPAIAPIRKSRL